MTPEHVLLPNYNVVYIDPSKTALCNTSDVSRSFGKSTSFISQYKCNESLEGNISTEKPSFTYHMSEKLTEK